jgi:hypothetical protein
VRANRAYRLIHTKGSRAPAFLAGPERMDQVEVVSIDDGEIVLFWDVSGAEAGGFVRALRADLSQLDAQAFIDRWSSVEGPWGFGPMPFAPVVWCWRCGRRGLNRRGKKGEPACWVLARATFLPPLVSFVTRAFAWPGATKQQRRLSSPAARTAGRASPRDRP